MKKKTDTIFNECTISYRSSASICSYLLFLFVVLESASLFSPSHIHTQLHAFAFDFHPVKNNHFFSSTYIDCAVITKRFGIRKIFVDIPRKRRILQAIESRKQFVNCPRDIIAVPQLTLFFPIKNSRLNRIERILSFSVSVHGIRHLEGHTTLLLLNCQNFWLERVRKLKKCRAGITQLTSQFSTVGRWTRATMMCLKGIYINKIYYKCVSEYV